MVERGAVNSDVEDSIASGGANFLGGQNEVTSSSYVCSYVGRM